MSNLLVVLRIDITPRVQSWRMRKSELSNLDIGNRFLVSENPKGPNYIHNDEMTNVYLGTKINNVKSTKWFVA